jgi:hypothetical protein
MEDLSSQASSIARFVSNKFRQIKPPPRSAYASSVTAIIGMMSLELHQAKKKS